MKAFNRILPGIICLALANCGPSGGDSHYASQEGTPGTFAALNVLSQADYVRLTGCQTDDSYVEANMLALEYLVFASDENEASEWGYRRRHIRPFFERLSDSEGIIPAKCLPQSTRLIGESMDLLKQRESLSKQPEAFFYEGGGSDFPEEDGEPLEVMSRSAYMAATGCLLSPSSWKFYKEAVRAYLDQQTSGQSALAEAVEALFAELYAGRPPISGAVSEQCLTPGVRTMGVAGGLLDSRG